MSRRSERVLRYGSYICRKWSSFCSPSTLLRSGMPVAVRSVRNFPRSATGRRSILRARGSAAKTSAKSTTAWREIVSRHCRRTGAQPRAPAYFKIFVTTPAPTVRPPSRIAKRNPSSIATGEPLRVAGATLAGM